MKFKVDDHFIAWSFIYAIAVFLSINAIKFLNFQGNLLGFFLAGLIITLFSWIMYAFLYKNNFKLNKWFFIWLFTHSFNFWLIDLALRKLGLTYNGFFYFLAFGIIYHSITWVIKHKIYYKTKMNLSKTLITILIFFIALIFVSSQPFSEIQTTGLNGNNSTASGFLSTLKNFFSFNMPSTKNSCPQIDIPMIKHKEFGYYITKMEDLDPSKDTAFYDEDIFNYYVQRRINNDTSDLQKGWEISVYTAAELFGIKSSMVLCHKGRVEGENPNYFYCDSGITGGIPYLSKTQMNSDGTIGKTIRKSFINVYDSERKFIKTICGKPPEDIEEEAFKQAMREMDDFFSLS